MSDRLRTALSPCRPSEGTIAGHRHRWSVVLLVALLALASPLAALAQDAPVYIRPGQVDLIKILAPAPLPGSTTTKEDLRMLLDLQALRTPAAVAAANADVVRNLSRFSEAVGTDLSKSAAPVANAVIDRAWDQSYALVTAVKQHWKRERPYLADPAIHLAVPAENTPSYPSGHATYGMEMAILLAAIVPEKATVIFARGTQFGFERLIGGVHYPSDVEAGRITGSVLAAELLRSAAFQADLARAAVEVRSALGLPPLQAGAEPAAPIPASAPLLPLPAAAAPAR